MKEKKHCSRCLDDLIPRGHFGPAYIEGPEGFICLKCIEELKKLFEKVLN